MVCGQEEDVDDGQQHARRLFLFVLDDLHHPVHHHLRDLRSTEQRLNNPTTLSTRANNASVLFYARRSFSRQRRDARACGP